MRLWALVQLVALAASAVGAKPISNTTSAVSAMSSICKLAFSNPEVQEIALRSQPIALVVNIVLHELHIPAENCTIRMADLPSIEASGDDLVALWGTFIGCAHNRNVTIRGKLTISNDETGLTARNFRVTGINATVDGPMQSIVDMLNFISVSDLSEDALTRGTRRILTSKLGFDIGRLATLLDKALLPKPSMLDALDSQTLLQTHVIDDAMSYVQTTLERVGNGGGFGALMPNAILTTFALRAVGAPESYVAAAANPISCFYPAQAVVVFENGVEKHRRIDQLQVGDRVQSAAAEGQRPSTTSVFFIQCVDASETIVSLHTHEGSVAVTPSHLVAVGDEEFVQAASLRIGDRILVVDDDGFIAHSRITGIRRSRGPFCDVKTEDGTLVAGRVVASVAATSHDLSQVLWSPVRLVYRSVPAVLKSEWVAKGLFVFSHSVAQLFGQLSAMNWFIGTTSA